MSLEPIPGNVQHCRNLLQGTDYDVFKRPPKRWTERFGGHPLEAQAYFLTGYLARADKDVRQDLRDLIRGVGIAMPPTVDEGGPVRPDPGKPEPSLSAWEFWGICAGALVVGALMLLISHPWVYP